ncbi:MAG: MFS transporter [Candidatus Odinarchaeota archaeon]
MSEYEVTSEKRDLTDFSNRHNINGYIIFWIGQLISLLGSSIVQFAIIWWITVETGSEFFLALAAFLGFGPTIVLTPVAGVFVDRWSRKKIIATVDFLQATITVLLIYLFVIGVVDVWSVLAIITCRGLLQAFQGPAVEAIIPLLIPRDILSRMNGLNYLFSGVIFLIGPLVGAMLLEWWTISDILWLDAITFLVAIVPTIIISIPPIKGLSAKVKDEKTSFREELTEGLVFIRNKQGLLALLSVFTAANFFLQPFFILLPLFVTKIHTGGAGELALLIAAQQAGLIGGSMLMSFWKGFRNKAQGVALGIFGMYAGLFICSTSPTGLFLLLTAGVFIIGFALPVANVSSQTIWQSVVPPEKLGRVFSVRVTIAQASAPLAMMLTGIIAGTIGIVYLLKISLFSGLLFLGYSWFFTGFRNVEKTLETSDTIVERSLTAVKEVISDRI